jgi:hypothetical protein
VVVGSEVAGDQAARAIARARTQLEASYVLGTAGPETFDCSGFTYWVAQPVIGPLDFELRSSHHQFNLWGVAVEPGQVRPGDLLFFDSMGVTVFGNRASHVGLYLGDGQMIHAANEEDGVIISRPFEGWYGPRFIGARRIFDLSVGAERRDPLSKGEQPRKTLPKISGEVQTPNQWNGGPFGVGWDAVTEWTHEIEQAVRETPAVDARALASVVMMETQGIHYRDGNVLQVWDAFPGDGPAIGITQLKPRLWGWLGPDLDPRFPGANIRLAARIIAHHLEATGGNLDAAMRRWFPARDPNGSTPDSYMRTFWGLMGELGYAS